MAKKTKKNWLAEARKKSVKDLHTERLTLSKESAIELVRLRMGESKKSSDYKEKRKNIARLNTLLNANQS